MPESPWHFPEDQLTDATDRMVATELTREQLYLQLHAEVPYSAAVETEKWEDRKDGSTVIHQQILIERDSQKAIILGKGGSRLKQIGQLSREAIAEHLGARSTCSCTSRSTPSGTRTAGSTRTSGSTGASKSRAGRPTAGLGRTPPPTSGTHRRSPAR